MEGHLGSDIVDQLLSKFPENICFAFAYGSAVVSQECTQSKKLTNGTSNGIKYDKSDVEEKMIDMIFVVDDPLTWHNENLKLNPSHYSFLGMFGPKFVTYLQRQFRAQIYFNVVPSVDLKTSSGDICTRSMKYGVIHTLDLVEDLLKWNNLYVSGRLHKPIQVLIRPTSALTRNEQLLNEAIVRNHKNAVYVALLLLPENFSEEDLYVTIAGLSYFGDFRMLVGEDKMKVSKIVAPQVVAFREIYSKHLRLFISNKMMRYDVQQRTYSISKSIEFLKAVSQILPESVKTLVMQLSEAAVKGNSYKSPQVQYKECTKKAITKIVWTSSISQGIKGFFTTGFLKAIKYCCRKMSRMVTSLN
ncbi:Phosphatidate cytidylyltransferase, mitochondrial [Halotydeus destructor]|nr:Phosphatidate cytidylyltransferase, mitochondrial [Halotydeus destructor]